MTTVLSTHGLFDAPGPGLPEHRATFGPLPGADPVELAAAAELTGRGGAGFPTAVKLRSVADAAVATRRSPVLVGNGAEGEPAAAKDAVLLSRAPHLVLDGLSLVARGLGATDVVLAAPEHLLPGLAARLAERPDGAAVRLHPAAAEFLSGEESALVADIDGDPPLPRSKLVPVRERGVDGRPTLVQNVETLARLALMARGDRETSGRTLVTRRFQRNRTPWTDVLEIPLGAPLGDVLPLDSHVRAVLVGGYHGTWLPAAVARGLPLDRAGLEPVGAALGAGVLAALPADRCGLRETARVVGYLAASSAGQCGPCLNGLPRIAAALAVLARAATPPPQLLTDIWRWCGLLPDRGACRHPDGTVRLVASALGVFAPEVRLHASGRCSATTTRPFLPVPGAVR
ncbi:NADH-ubiquinone oxidoreductase-F iron-sulfur binding region domain-containing protein [Petropleomorpha daqingensis]|uniref:NADH:ubiquinone oxidoreductase subunit F (NADH-binding) n=1 Tax=Petropleomorpha daqingensis TaxID=2026353 RepID=A0A853CD91_9ACTN|nr:NADH-ubiquinone oxidoreductase-F iron-sulfur binding region domain-containing protein [Petropleomorpha daqingensis]NYJ05036.1 NADH:ubiquinone oxidoreductase subunit F (NADH-binding) [Petropleomorpha daqingensis]